MLRRYVRCGRFANLGSSRICSPASTNRTADGSRLRHRSGITRSERCYLGWHLEANLRRNLEAKLDMLEAQGVTIVDRRQTYLDESADVSRICSGAILYPGTRLI